MISDSTAAHFADANSIMSLKTNDLEGVERNIINFNPTNNAKKKNKNKSTSFSLYEQRIQMMKETVRKPPSDNLSSGKLKMLDKPRK